MIKNSIRDIANETGINKNSVYKLKKKGYLGEELKKQASKVSKEKEIGEKRVKKSKKIKFDENLVKISDVEGSTIYDTLNDAKSNYDFNNTLIKKLSAEVQELQTTLQDNRNGTVSTLPQVKEIRELTKLNIALRKQICELEELLGIVPDGQGSDDPF